MTMAISWSRWSDFDQCPRKFYLKYVEKADTFKEDEKDKSLHLIRGQQLHKQLENYVLWKHDMAAGTMIETPDGMHPPPRPAMSPETESVTPLIDKILATSDAVLPESQIAVDREWKQVEWFSKKAAIRAILDLIALRKDHGIIWDYKTGKFKPYADECGQLHLSAAIIIALKGLDYVDVSYLFLDSKTPSGIRVTQEGAVKVIKIFDERYDRVNSEVTWAPKRNEFCGFCNATKAQCPNSKKF
jgi:CRISPR/Cas system-associated exonuclease Cas4 (RecB family)